MQQNFFKFFSIILLLTVFLFPQSFFAQQFSVVKSDAERILKQYESGTITNLTSAEKQILSGYLESIQKPNNISKERILSPDATVFLDEDFTGQVLPTGWTNVDNGSSGQIWEFNNPYPRTITGNFDADFVILDSDNYGSGGSQNATLTTIAIDCGTATNVTLGFDQQFRSYSGSSGTVEVSNDGTNWTLIDSITVSSGYPNPPIYSEYDITSVAAGYSTVYVRWTYVGSWAYWWAIDNVVIYEPDALPLPAIVVNPLDTETDVFPSTTLDWVAGGGSAPTGYRLYFGTDGGGVSLPTSIENNTDLGLVTQYMPAAALTFGTTYYWSLVPYNLAGDATGNPIWSFTTLAPSAPVVICYSRATANERSNIDSVLFAFASSGFTSFDTLNRDSRTPDLSYWKTAIWCEEGSIQPAERQAMEDFLDAGTTNDQRSLLIAGDDIGYFHGRLASTSYDSVFYSGYLHALYFLDDGNGAPDQSRICGEVVNTGLCDSISSSYPDGIGVVNGGVVAYRFADLPGTSDTVVSVAYDGPTYNVLYHAFEFREIVMPVTEDVSRIMSGSLSWIESVGGIIPVELASFTSIVKGNDVTLNWKTVTETNNSGFAIERKSGQNSGFIQIGNVPGRGTTTEPVNYSYTDEDLNSGIYTYRLKQIDLDGTFKYVGTIEVEVVPPKVFALEQNYPNPFNPATIIKYSVPVKGFVSLSIFNVIGEKVTELINKEVEAGSYQINFDASNLSSGVYFYKLEAGNFTSIKKMMFIK